VSNQSSAATVAVSLLSPENLLEQIPLELCIGFLQDPSPAVRNSSKEMIGAYMELGGGAEVSSPSVWMVPRIVELVQKLSALVHKGRANPHPNSATTAAMGTSNTSRTTSTTTELRTDLNLLAGYLKCLDTTSSSAALTAKKSRAMDASMRNAIVSSKQLRRGLIRKFDFNIKLRLFVSVCTWIASSGGVT
jgi:hypothetical protein